MRITATAIVILLLAALATTASARDAAPPAYVALGDSLASGEGARPDTYLPGTSFADPATGGRSSTGCHRSTTAWPFRVQARTGAPSLTFVACSGATIADLTAANDQFAAVGELEPPQIDAVTSATTLATLSIGAKEAGFTEVLAACLYRPEDTRGAGCGRPGSAARRIAAGGLRGLDLRLADAYAAIAARMAPGGRLVVVGYPRLFAAGGEGYVTDRAVGAPACRLGLTPFRTPVRVTRPDAAWLNREAGRLDATISHAVSIAAARLAAAGSTVSVALVPVDRAIASHRLCGPSPWINALRLTATGAPKRTSFHPDAKGQAAYARAVAGALGTPG